MLPSELTVTDWQARIATDLGQLGVDLPASTYRTPAVAVTDRLAD
ncbi:hypothetical protein GCM10017690_26430 [Microbacterium terregens]